jgi:hypothetical protein
MDRRTTWAGYRILLVAMAIQGVTPDCDNLVSSRLLRLIASGWTGGPAADGASTPMQTPIPPDDGDGDPGLFCSKVAAGCALRVRLDTGDRRFIHFIPIHFLERSSRSVPRPFDPPGVALRGSDSLYACLCRFLC